MTFSTVSQMFEQITKEHSARKLYFYKKTGEWHGISGSEIRSTVKDLAFALERIRPDVRVLGNDYYLIDTGGPAYFTGAGTEKEIYYHDRSNHGWSTSEIRRRIFKAELDKGNGISVS